jgi:putative FmdB family regulatory protein
MPTYEYRCENGHTFEQFQKMSDPAVDVCPQCGAPAERLMSAGAGLVFKGSGFYITDYRNENYKKAAESDKSGAAGSAGAAPAPDVAARTGSASTDSNRSEASKSDSGKAAKEGGSSKPPADSGKSASTTPSATPKSSGND